MPIFLGSSVFGALELRQCADAPAACPFRQQQADSAAPSLGTRMRCLAIDRAETAADWLRPAVTHAGDMAALRQLVAGETRSVGLSNHQVIDLVAQKVARRDLCLLASSLLASGTQVQPRQAPPPAATGVTPSTLSPRAETVVPVVGAPPIAEFAATLSQAVQAAALEHAAGSGLPFCEMCEKARQQAAAPAGGAA